MSTETITNQDALPPEGDYYVTVRQSMRNRNFRALLGPYEDLRDALANVRRGQLLVAEKNGDPFNEYLYGTSRLPMGTTIETVFGR